MFKIGVVINYFDKLGVAIVELDGGLTAGDTIKFVKEGEDLFSQKVESIQVEHDKVDFAGKGATIGIKTEKEVMEGAEVFKVG